ncbi:MAG: hypothetical protein QNJ94_13335 [Alphaproteobacteria bacterium]|nr:hypothetical protein [Alphaproteobacteria bacterium]
MGVHSIARIDRAIDELRALEQSRVRQVRPIIERLVAVRRGHCDSPDACRHCHVPCGSLAQAEQEVRGRAGGWGWLKRRFRRA